jgi:hypothetical protein
MKIDEHPRVFFRTTTNGDFGLGWGYLAMIDGVAWLSARGSEQQQQKRQRDFHGVPHLLPAILHKTE